MHEGLHKRFEEILVAGGALDKIKLTVARSQCAREGIPLWKYVVQRGWITPAEVASSLATATGMTYVLPRKLVRDKLREELVGQKVLRRLRALAIKGFDGNTFAVGFPTELSDVFELESITGSKVGIVISDADAIDAALEGQWPERRETSQIAIENKRVARRFECNDPVRCEYNVCDDRGGPLSPQVHKAVLRNVSVTGCLLEGELPSPLAEQLLKMKGTALSVKVLPPKGLPFDMIGTVRRQVEMSAGKGELGLRWDPASDADLGRYRELMLYLEQHS